MTAGSFWSSKCCSVESRAGKPAQNVGIVAIALAGSNKLSFIFDPEVSLSPKNIHVTIAAWIFILPVRQNVQPFTFLDNVFFDRGG